MSNSDNPQGGREGRTHPQAEREHALSGTGDEMAGEAGEDLGFDNPFGGGADMAGPDLAGNGGWAAEGASIATEGPDRLGDTGGRDGTLYPGHDAPPAGGSD